MEKIQEQAAENGASDRMAKARASRKKRKTAANRPAMPTSEITWYLMGRKDESGPSEVISTYPNRVRLAKGFASMRPMIERMYVEVSVIRGKDYNLEDLM